MSRDKLIGEVDDNHKPLSHVDVSKNSGTPNHPF